jgi:hypothetical protein
VRLVLELLGWAEAGHCQEPLERLQRLLVQQQVQRLDA